MKIGFSAVATAALLKTAGVSAQDAGGRRLGNSVSFGDVKPTPAPSANPTATPTMNTPPVGDSGSCWSKCCDNFESRCSDEDGMLDGQYCKLLCQSQISASAAPTATPEDGNDSASPNQEISGSANFEPSKVAGLIAAGAAVVGTAAAALA